MHKTAKLHLQYLEIYSGSPDLLFSGTVLISRDQHPQVTRGVLSRSSTLDLLLVQIITASSKTSKTEQWHTLYCFSLHINKHWDCDCLAEYGCMRLPTSSVSAHTCGYLYTAQRTSITMDSNSLQHGLFNLYPVEVQNTLSLTNFECAEYFYLQKHSICEWPFHIFKFHPNFFLLWSR